MDWLGVLLLVVLNGWLAWRYAHQPIGPDEGHYLCWGVTGAVPYRDFLDPKPPGIHLWMRGWGLLTGGSIPWMKGLHHLAMGGLIVLFYAFTGQLGSALVLTAWLQSGWLLAFQSWSDALSTAFAVLALVGPSGVRLGFAGLAVLTNYKLAPALGLWFALQGAWVEIAVGAGLLAALVGGWRLAFREGFLTVWYSIVTLPRRMADEHRTQFPPTWVEWPHFFGAMVLWVGVVIGVIGWTGQFEWRLWLVALAYGLVNARGRVWLPNHSIPLGMVAVTRVPLVAGLAVLAVDWISLRGYLGNTWAIVYPGIAEGVAWARLVGERVREHGGRIWVNSYFTEIYAYARQAPAYGMFEMIESRSVARERAHRRDYLLRTNKPDTIIIGPGALAGEPENFKLIESIGPFGLWG